MRQQIQWVVTFASNVLCIFLQVAIMVSTSPSKEIDSGIHDTLCIMVYFSVCNLIDLMLIWSLVGWSHFKNKWTYLFLAFCTKIVLKMLMILFAIEYGQTHWIYSVTICFNLLTRNKDFKGFKNGCKYRLMRLGLITRYVLTGMQNLFLQSLGSASVLVEFDKIKLPVSV